MNVKMQLIHLNQMFLMVLLLLFGLVVLSSSSSSNSDNFHRTHNHHHHHYGDESSSFTTLMTNRTNSIVKQRNRYYIGTINSAHSTSSSNGVVGAVFSDDNDNERSGSVVVPKCGGCRMRNEIKSRNLEVIKSEVLRRMGFHSPPNITGRVLPPVPAHFLAKLNGGRWYGGGGAYDDNMQSDQPSAAAAFKTGYSFTEEDDDYHMKTQQILIFAQPYPKLRHSSNSWRNVHHDILHFKFTDSITKFRVRNATLYIYVKSGGGGGGGGGGGSSSTNTGSTTIRTHSTVLLIEVFKIVKPPEQHELPPLMHCVLTKKIQQPFGKGDWIQVDFSGTISEWFKNPDENFGFVVNVTDGLGRRLSVVDFSTDETNSKTPYVEISTMEAKRRTRRSIALNCDDKMNEPLCCRYPLVVDFEDFGWDFIIAPKRYDAHYCSGECPYVTMQKYPHTHLVNIAFPNSAQPCCSPRKMSSISMIYFDRQLNVVYGNLPGMVVEQCGCS